MLSDEDRLKREQQEHLMHRQQETDEDRRKREQQEAYLESRRQETAEYYQNVPVRHVSRQRGHSYPSCWVAFVVNLILPGLGFLMLRRWTTSTLYLVLAVTMAVVFWPTVPFIWLISFLHLSVAYRGKLTRL